MPDAKRKEGLVDRRIEKSRAAFRKALEELAAQKDFEKITVSEICDRANMSRPAFYDNYRSKQALLHDVMLRQLEGFARAGETSCAPFFEEALRVVRNSPVLQRNVAARSVGGELMAALDNLFIRYVGYMVERNGWRQRDSRIPAEAALVYVARGLGGVMELWMRGGCAEKEKDVAQAMARLVEGTYQTA